MPDIFLGVGDTSVSKNRQGSYSHSREERQAMDRLSNKQQENFRW